MPEFSTDDWAELFNLQFNLVRSEPRDFRVMSAHTLSDERNLLQVSVRRLMILLRKIAIERGMDFVFESNHERFREGIRVMLEDLLQFMFERGAFSGAAADQAFRVITDVSINTPQSVEQGRFIAQIQVAPSQPMEFITVLLTRIGEGALQATEV
jgi:phage tail sheath protein FI